MSMGTFCTDTGVLLRYNLERENQSDFDLVYIFLWSFLCLFLFYWGTTHEWLWETSDQDDKIKVVIAR